MCFFDIFIFVLLLFFLFFFIYLSMYFMNALLGVFISFVFLVSNLSATFQT